MSWLDIIKVKPGKKQGDAARDVRIVLVEAGFPLTYIGDINMTQWGPGEHSKILQINPTYLIEAANDFNAWSDNIDLAYQTRDRNVLATLANRVNDEEAKERIVELINQAIHKSEKDKYKKETTFGND